MSIPIRLFRRCARPSSHAPPPFFRLHPPTFLAARPLEDSPSPPCLATTRAPSAAPAPTPAPHAPLPAQTPIASPQSARPMPSACLQDASLLFLSLLLEHALRPLS